ncbi:MAG: HD domain-containing protein [Acidobacteriia bacterium]|nr:HD domain-containing protein [Terriglobia bacterium]
MIDDGEEPLAASGEPVKVSAGIPPIRRRGRILFSLLAVFVIVGLVPLATVAWKLIDVNREALKTSQQEYQLLMASSVARDVDGQVDALRAQLSSLAKGIGGLLGHSGTVDPETIRRALADIADDRMTYLRYMDFRGGMVDTRSTATLPPDLDALFFAGLRRSAESMSEGRGGTTVPTISEPILLAGGAPRAVAILSAPVVSGGMFRGILSALVDLQAVWDGVAGGNRTGHTMFALDSKGRVFATSARSSEAPDRDFARSEIARKFLNAPGRARETMPFTLQRNGKPERYLGSYEVTREGWGVFVQAKERQVYLPVRDMVASTLRWALLALSLAILAAVVSAGTLSTPIDRLAAATRAFAAGDLSHRVQVRSRNEIGELAEAFNRMASQIEDSIGRLKQAAEENNQLFLGTIRALAQAIDTKDPYTRGHSVRVNKYSVIIARYIGLPRDEIQNIHVASLLHDVGKIGIDDAILKKPARLTADEMSVMRTHTALGASIMSPIRQMAKILPGLRSHHERWRGDGYPDALEGEAIPLMARIIAVADTFDAMTTTRPYQRACTFEDAVRRLNEMKGTALEEKVVEAFNRAYHAGEFRPEERASQAVQSATA